MSFRHRQLKRRRYHETRPRCQHAGCENKGFECVINCEDADLVEYFCGEHAHEHGYCRGCGHFWGGVEYFDFGSGLCEICQHSGDYDDYYDEEMDFGLP